MVNLNVRIGARSRDTRKLELTSNLLTPDDKFCTLSFCRPASTTYLKCGTGKKVTIMKLSTEEKQYRGEKSPSIHEMTGVECTSYCRFRKHKLSQKPELIQIGIEKALLMEKGNTGLARQGRVG